MKKLTINMLSSADKVAGQGVGSAYLEQVSLVKEGAPKLFNVVINSNKKADIIHIHTVDLQNYFKMKLAKVPTVAYVHFLPETLDGSIKLPKPIFSIFKKYVTDFYNTADRLVVVNPIFIEDLVRHGIPREKIYYIPNYVSKESFFKAKKSEIILTREKYGLKESDFVVLGVGQVQTRKGVLDFVDVAKKIPDLKFVWCGGFSFGKITDGYDELKKVYDNPPKNVKFVGIIPREEMNNMYNMADVLFMPSYNELFPMSILEAVNIEKPVLLRDLELYEDILFNKYYKGHTKKDFVGQLKKLKEDDTYYKKGSKYSKEINEYYSKEHILKIWIDFYQDTYNNGKNKTVKEKVES